MTADSYGDVPPDMHVLPHLFQKNGLFPAQAGFPAFLQEPDMKQIKPYVSKQKANKVFKKLQKLEFADKTLAMVVPKEAFELINEGNNLHHCVGSYIKRVAKNESMIFFVRKQENLLESYFTLEIDPKNLKIVQCRGLHNVSADDKILNFVHRWKKERLNKLKVE